VGFADLDAVDLSVKPTNPTVLVSQADAEFSLTADKTRIVYTYSTGGPNGAASAQSGLWVMPVP
jgi:hypothetical protein